MYIVKEKTCSTCSHWHGLRAMEENGFVYSLENLEGICKDVKHDTDGNGFGRTLTFPGSYCEHWDQWPDILS